MNSLMRIIVVVGALVSMCLSISYADSTSNVVVQGILSSPSCRQELSQVVSAIDQLLGNKSTIEEPAVHILREAKATAEEMLNNKVGVNAGKLVDLAVWIKAKQTEIASIQDSGKTRLTEVQQVYSNSKLFKSGFETSLTTPLRGILAAYLENDGSRCPVSLLEASLKLYLNFRPVLEEDGYALPDKILLHAPQWIESRYLQLSELEKRQFLRDINAAQKAASMPLADSVPASTPTKVEKDAYNSAYEFIKKNTPESN